MVLVGCTPHDPIAYAQMACADQDGLVSGKCGDGDYRLTLSTRKSSVFSLIPCDAAPRLSRARGGSPLWQHLSRLWHRMSSGSFQRGPSGASVWQPQAAPPRDPSPARVPAPAGRAVLPSSQPRGGAAAGPSCSHSSVQNARPVRCGRNGVKQVGQGMWLSGLLTTIRTGHQFLCCPLSTKKFAQQVQSCCWQPQRLRGTGRPSCSNQRVS
jgi:hypothetical protein